MNPTLILVFLVAFAFLGGAAMLFAGPRPTFSPVRRNIATTGNLVPVLLGKKSEPVQQVWSKRDPRNKRPFVRSGRGSPTHRPKAYLRNATPTQRANWRRHPSYR